MAQKRIKMVLYGEPGVGKSVFACKAPKPFFICSDGNYAWLEDFGADPDAYVEVSSWEEAKKAFANIPDDCETVVVDLLEDLFRWCEREYCTRNKIEHLSDLGYGKGYDATRNEFFIEICKLISLDKNVIFIMHGLSITVKDRRGVEHTKYIPSTRLPDKVIDMVEGRVRYFLRCYIKDVEVEEGKIQKKRFLSLVPKPNEFGIIRGVNENEIPQDIPLEFSEFAKIVGLDVKKEKTTKKITKKVESKTEKIEEPEEKTETKTEETPEKTEPIKEEPKAEEIIPEEKTETKIEEPKTLSNEDKLAAIRAKLAKLNSMK